MLANIQNHYFTGQTILLDKNKRNLFCSHSSPHPTQYVNYTGRFTMFSVITNIYSEKTKGPTSMELFTATGKLKKIVFYN